MARKPGTSSGRKPTTKKTSLPKFSKVNGSRVQWTLDNGMTVVGTKKQYDKFVREQVKNVKRTNKTKQLKAKADMKSKVTKEQRDFELKKIDKQNKLAMFSEGIAAASSTIAGGTYAGVNSRANEVKQQVDGGMTDKGQIGRDENDKPATEYSLGEE